MEFYETIKNKPHDVDVVNKDNHMWTFINGMYYPCLVIDENAPIPEVVENEVGVAVNSEPNMISERVEDNVDATMMAIIIVSAIMVFINAITLI